MNKSVKSVPKIEPRGTPENNISHELTTESTFVLCLRLVRKEEMKFIGCISNPDALKLAISKFRLMQSNAFKRLVKVALVSLSSSRVLHHFSTGTK